MEDKNHKKTKKFKKQNKLSITKEEEIPKEQAEEENEEIEIEEQEESNDEKEEKSIIDYDNELNEEQTLPNKMKNDEDEKEKEDEPQNKKAKKPKGFKVFHLTEEIYQGIKNIGYKNPTPIQKKIIPEIMSGFNIIAHSRTGSGKTAAFLLPMLAKLKKHSQIVGTRCLILSPVRDLAYQTGMFCRKLGKYTDLRFALIAGGKGFDDQFERLAQNPDIIGKFYNFVRLKNKLYY